MSIATILCTLLIACSGIANTQGPGIGGTVTPIEVEPGDWLDEGIGGSVGSIRFLNQGQLSIVANGYDIWNEVDAFHYAYLPLEGSIEIIVRVAELQDGHAFAKAGIMMRQSLDSGARNVAVLVTPERGVRMQYRDDYKASTSKIEGGSSSAPIWLRLVRLDNVFTSYRSADGASWTLIGSVELDMPEFMYVGVAASSHDPGRTTIEAVFDQVQITGDLADADLPPNIPPPDLPPGGELAGDPTLLQAYWHNIRAGDDIRVGTEHMLYLPRQLAENTLVDERFGERRLSDVGPYLGWDVLVTDTNGSYRRYPEMDFLYLHLNRPARVAVVLANGNPSNLPSWLRSWERGHDVKVWGSSQPTFETNLPAGPNYLGTLEDKGSFYTVLLSEADGTPSPEPAVPAGLERPQPNQTCPDWVHDQYTAEGSDGQMYRTYHHQIDPVYWCYFQHEHGSEPAQFADGSFDPLFNHYVDVTGRHEPHGGFKGVLLRDEDGREIYLTVHFTSSDIGRACVRHHGLDMAFAEDDGEIVGILNFKGDFGIPYAIEAGNIQLRMEPSACPEVAYLPAGTLGKRNIPVDMDGTGYESWQWSPVGAPALPFIGSFTLVTDNPMARCTYNERRSNGLYLCDTPSYRGGNQDGSLRWMIFPGNRPFGFDTTQPGSNSGTFCTDYTGAVDLQCDNPLAVEQWLKPNTRFLLRDGPGKWEVREPWQAVYENFRDDLIRINRNLEDQIPIPHEN